MSIHYEHNIQEVPTFLNYGLYFFGKFTVGEYLANINCCPNPYFGPNLLEISLAGDQITKNCIKVLEEDGWTKTIEFRNGNSGNDVVSYHKVVNCSDEKARKYKKIKSPNSKRYIYHQDNCGINYIIDPHTFSSKEGMEISIQNFIEKNYAFNGEIGFLTTVDKRKDKNNIIEKLGLEEALKIDENISLYSKVAEIDYLEDYDDSDRYYQCTGTYR